MTTGQARGQRRHDWRLPAVAAVAWGGALLGLSIGRWATVALPVCGALALVLTRTWFRRQGDGAGPGRWLAVLLATTAVFCFLGAVRGEVASQRVVAALAAEPRSVQFTGVVGSDVKAVRSGFGDRVRILVDVESAARGRSGWKVRDRVMLFADEFDRAVQLGSGVRFDAVPAAPSERGAPTTRWVLRGELQVLHQPDLWWRVAEAVRRSLRDVVADRPPDQRALVPSLVVGDDSRVSEELAEEFRSTGLTHLLAVSGTNLTLLMGVVVGVGTWCGVRGRWRMLLVAGCVAGFVLVARSEPSVVRAATMGTVAVFALERHASDRGLRCLALAVMMVLAIDPWMARSVGLSLSVLATAGILVLTPVWSRALAAWMPRWVALAVAVPLAAQWAVTPVVTALQGEISIVAVAANVAAAPAVAPATVIGLLAGLVGLVHSGAGEVIALPAAWAVGWIAAVAGWGAGTAVPAVPWGTAPGWIAALTVLTGMGVLVAPILLRRWWVVLPVTGLLVAVVLRGLPTPGWPPEGWVVAACDVGQGDALVVRTGEQRALVVDAGPSAPAVDRCLGRLGVREIDLLVLTHFHADHIDGLPGVLAGRRLHAVELSPVEDPARAAAQVHRTVAAVGVPVNVSRAGETTRVGEVTVQRIWPLPRAATTRSTPGGAEGEQANDASVVLWVEVKGTTVLLTGDIEPPAQRQVARLLDGVQVDVLKVPHHGSRHQDFRFLTGLAPRVALVSAGSDNTYGHPSQEVLDAFAARGTTLLRTDRAGDAVVVRTASGLGTVTMNGH